MWSEVRSSTRIGAAGIREESMTQAESIYDSPRLAAGYAYDRPPIHRRIIQRVRESLHITGRLTRVLDVGCGAGLSTAALAPLADTVVGLEPVRAMLTHSRAVAPHALFLVGQAERLPFSAGAFDLITAAGSINYVDRDLFLPDAARLLAPGGVLIIYDFSAGRRMRGGHRLAEWFARFERRYPSPSGYALDVRGLAYSRFGLRLQSYEELEIAVPMPLGAYLPYVLSETRVERAISHGVPEAEIRSWCQSTLADVFGDTSHDVLFESYVAYVSCDSNA
jgi:SAM-dependent methyltransferase